MTMRIKITNCGNRTGDYLRLHKDGEARTEKSLLALLYRGQSYDVDEQEGGILFSAGNTGNDDFVDEPEVSIHDRPRTRGIDDTR